MRKPWGTPLPPTGIRCQ